MHMYLLNQWWKYHYVTRERSYCTCNYWDPAFPHLRFYKKRSRGHNHLFGAQNWCIQFPHPWWSTFITVLNPLEPRGMQLLVPYQIIWSWYTGRWWMGCYIWYSEEGPGRGPSPPRPLLAVPNVTAHPSTASVPITVLQYSGPLLCGFNMDIKRSFKSISSVYTKTRSAGRGRLRHHSHKFKIKYVTSRTDPNLFHWP